MLMSPLRWQPRAEDDPHMIELVEVLCRLRSILKPQSRNEPPSVPADFEIPRLPTCGHLLVIQTVIVSCIAKTIAVGSSLVGLLFRRETEESAATTLLHLLCKRLVPPDLNIAN